MYEYIHIYYIFTVFICSFFASFPLPYYLRATYFNSNLFAKDVIYFPYSIHSTYFFIPKFLYSSYSVLILLIYSLILLLHCSITPLFRYFFIFIPLSIYIIHSSYSTYSSTSPTLSNSYTLPLALYPSAFYTVYSTYSIIHPINFLYHLVSLYHLVHLFYLPLLHHPFHLLLL